MKITNNDMLQYTGKEYTEELQRYNDCYWVCSDRKKLVGFGKELKRLWIQEKEDELERLNNIKL